MSKYANDKFGIDSKGQFYLDRFAIEDAYMEQWERDIYRPNKMGRVYAAAEAVNSLLKEAQKQGLILPTKILPQRN